MTRILIGLCWIDYSVALAATHSGHCPMQARVRGHWLVKTIKVGKIEKL